MKIPRDLKPGDRLWYSKTEYATVANRLWGKPPYFDDGDIMAYNASGLVMYYSPDGHEIDDATPPIIRIERIASKPAKPKRDADAAWLLKQCKPGGIIDPSDRQYTRLRRIAKRLERSAS